MPPRLSLGKSSETMKSEERSTDGPHQHKPVVVFVVVAGADGVAACARTCTARVLAPMRKTTASVARCLSIADVDARRPSPPVDVEIEIDRRIVIVVVLCVACLLWQHTMGRCMGGAWRALCYDA